MFPRKFLPLLALCSFIVFAAMPARTQEKEASDPQAALRARIDQTIKALGGVEKLDALKMAEIKAKLGVLLGENKQSMTLDGTFDGLGRIRYNLEGFRGGNLVAIFVFNGDKVWRLLGKNLKELTGEGKDQADFFAHETYALRLAQMPNLLKNPAFELSVIGEETIDDQPAIGMRVCHKGRPDVNLYLDKKTSLPVKCELRYKGFAGQFNAFEEKAFEIFLSDYKDFDGAKQFSKIAIKADGKLVMDLELTEINSLETVAADTFAEPKVPADK